LGAIRQNVLIGEHKKLAMFTVGSVTIAMVCPNDLVLANVLLG
jgi:hypothetical protein